jgi:Leucine-rich repeat (LRR) protein
MILAKPTHPLIILFLASLTGCSGNPTPEKTLISAHEFKDSYIAKCVKDSAASQNATYVHELKWLDCRGERLSADDFGPRGYASSTQGLEALTALESLSLDGNWLATLDFSKFLQLREVSIGYNLFQTLDFSKNSQLESLEISCNPISKLALPTSGKLQELQANLSIYAGRPVCGHLPPAEVTSNLIDINTNQPINDQSYLKPVALWLNLAKQTGLQKINLNSRGLTDLSLDTLPKQNKVRELGIADNALDNLDISNLPELQSFDATKAQLKNIKFANPSKLTSLRLNGNSIDNTTLQQINTLPELTQLYMTANKQLTLAPAMAKLTQLTLDGDRDWDGADFTALPALQELSMEMGTGSLSNTDKLSAPQLKSLSLGKVANQTLTLSHLDSLEVLSAWGGEIKAIDIGKLNALKTLRISSFTGNSLNLSSSANLRSLSITSKTLAQNGLTIPYQLTQLDLSGMVWNTLETTGLSNIEQLTLTNVALNKLDLSDLTNLNRLGLYRLANLRELDLTPLASSLTYLTLWDNAIEQLNAVSFHQPIAATFYSCRFNNESRTNIERLTNTRVYMFGEELPF